MKICDAKRSGVPRRALISVSDKTGIGSFATRLQTLGFELVSTGGTAQALRAAGLTVRDISELTGFPEMLQGRVKTLHPRVHGGLLGRWFDPEHRRQMEAQGIGPIEVLVVNLYPFEAVAERAGSGDGVEFGELIENIDIGGPAMLRSGAKNFESVAVVTDPADYETVAAELEEGGEVSLATRWRLARAALARTAAYDAAITTALSELSEAKPGEKVRLQAAGMPAVLYVNAPRRRTLRYGENPHQQAALYTEPIGRGGMARAEVLQGKEASYNNLVDLDAAWELVQDLDPARAAVAIIKHTNPAGCAQADTLVEAYQQALACDPVSAFGSVISVNRELDAATAEAMAGLFVECIAAPGYSAEALERLSAKKNLRLVKVDAGAPGRWALRTISGGWLLQEADRETLPAGDAGWRVVTKRAPTPEEGAGMRFGWRVVKHVKSNAVLFARSGQTLAVGAGQMSRVDAVQVAVQRAHLPLKGSSVASDAFFPFPDGIEAAAAAGATAVIQPGGSVRDADAIAACDRLGLTMVFTGMRHFRH